MGQILLDALKEFHSPLNSEYLIIENKTNLYLVVPSLPLQSKVD